MTDTIKGAIQSCDETKDSGRVGETASSLDQSIVFGMGADPEPDKTVVLLDSKGAMVKPHARRPEATDLLQMHGGMSRVLCHQCENGKCRLLRLVRQFVKTLTKPWGGPMPHRSTHRPWRRSPRASSAKPSSRPAATSPSNWRSQACASNSENQARKASNSDGSRLRIASSISCTVPIITLYSSRTS